MAKYSYVFRYIHQINKEQKMKQLFLILLITVFVLPYAVAQQAAEVSLAFTRQRGVASNQFAVWVENEQGQYIRTLYATRWTANGGWRRRPTSIPVWVSRSALSEKSREQVDAVSGATGQTGNRIFVWDGADSNGNPVPPGNYVIFVEGTLRWDNQALYRAPFVLGQGTAQAEVSVEYRGDSTAERSMLSNVRVRVLR